MLNINYKTKNILNAKSSHLDAICCRIRRKIDGSKCGNSSCLICRFNCVIVKGVPDCLKIKLLDQFTIQKLISGLPNEIYDLNDQIWKELIVNYSFDDLKRYLKIRNKDFDDMSVDENDIYFLYNDTYKVILKIFDYDNWFQNQKQEARYDIYELAKNLDRNSCTYCNRIYTSTIVGKNKQKVMRPAFDHWFPQKKYPLLALSFYNLIPSCTICNSSIKSDTEFLTKSHIHPYIDMDSLDRLVFSYDHFKTLDSYMIKLKFKPNDIKAFTTFNELKTKDIYNAHISELKDLVKIKEAYSTNYLNFLIDKFPKAKLSKEEVYKLAFGVELKNDNFHKRPLSKFKSDILKELGII